MTRGAMDEPATHEGTSAEAKNDSQCGDMERPKVVLILGAGASAAAGYKTFFTFPYMFWPTPTEPAALLATEKETALLRAIEQELDRQNRPTTMDQFLWILNDYNAALRSVFASPELRSQFSDSILVFSRLKELSDSLISVLRRICSLTARHYATPPCPEYVTRVTRFYEEFLEATGAPLRVFTTNYDLVPEYLFSEEFRKFGKIKYPNWAVPDNTPDIKLVNGIAEFESLQRDDFMISSTSGASNNAEKERYQWKERVYDAAPSKSRNRIDYYRLHGCVGWFYDRSQAQDSPAYFDVKAIDDIDEAYERFCVMYPGHEVQPGTEPHGKGFCELYDGVYHSDIVIFVGFSMRDDDVMTCVLNSIYDSNEAKKPLKKILVLDQTLDKQEIGIRCNSLKSRVSLPIIDLISEGNGSPDCKLEVERISFPPESVELNAIIRSHILPP